ncbi:MAG: PEP/pyruvate-binding domain-containing protein [Bacteroidota bacterium]
MIIKHTDIAALPNSELGGKATNLFLLTQNGFNVPAFSVIPANYLKNIGITPTYENKEETIQKIEALDLAELTSNILSSLPQINYFAVRSSAKGEDGAENSFAGQFDSYLFVSPIHLAEHIKKVWISLYNQRAATYRETNNINNELSIAVIVQEMINPSVSGVAFGINPISGNRKEKVINATWGLGEGIVSGELTADTFILKDISKYESFISKKSDRIIIGNNGGTIKESVPTNLQETPALESKQIEQIGAVLTKLYQITHKYQDIEFCFKDNQLFLLQTRPITTLNTIPDASAKYVVWDNSNIIESYPGITSPLTFSFITGVYETAYRQFMKMMGVKDFEIEENKEVFANMLGLIHGKVYYNLRSWYVLLSMLPGYSVNAEFMEKMMGVKERFVLDDVKKEGKLKSYRRILGMISSIISNLRSLPKQRILFSNHFDQINAQYQNTDLSASNLYELMNLYREYEHTLLTRWKAPLVNDFFAMIYFGVLQKLVVSYGIDESGTLHNDLVGGAKDIISTEPIRLLIELAKEINSNSDALALFSEKPANTIFIELEKEKYFSIKTKIDNYLKNFGDRYVGELKLETETYNTKPLKFIELLKSYSLNKASWANFSLSNGTTRENAEEIVKNKLKNKAFKRMIFNYFLNKSRDLISNRENLRFYRTKGFGTARKLFAEIGNKFYAEGIIASNRDIFYLTKQEIFDLIEGKSSSTDVISLIEYRKKVYLKYESHEPMDERVTTWCIPYFSNQYKNEKIEDSSSENSIKGIGCSKGIVRAKVRIVRSPDELSNLNGDILVTSSTDPGWVTLFPTASGILVERGSLLSHSAIVAREMGIPCVVGISNLLYKLKTGDEVIMNGTTGTVEIIEV